MQRLMTAPLQTTLTRSGSRTRMLQVRASCRCPRRHAKTLSAAASGTALLRKMMLTAMGYHFSAAQHVGVLQRKPVGPAQSTGLSATAFHCSAAQHLAATQRQPAGVAAMVCRCSAAHHPAGMVRKPCGIVGRRKGTCTALAPRCRAAPHITGMLHEPAGLQRLLKVMCMAVKAAVLTGSSAMAYRCSATQHLIGIAYRQAASTALLKADRKARVDGCKPVRQLMVLQHKHQPQSAGHGNTTGRLARQLLLHCKPFVAALECSGPHSLWTLWPPSAWRPCGMQQPTICSTPIVVTLMCSSRMLALLGC